MTGSKREADREGRWREIDNDYVYMRTRNQVTVRNQVLTRNQTLHAFKFFSLTQM